MALASAALHSASFRIINLTADPHMTLSQVAEASGVVLVDRPDALPTLDAGTRLDGASTFVSELAASPTGLALALGLAGLMVTAFGIARILSRIVRSNLAANLRFTKCL